MICILDSELALKTEILSFIIDRDSKFVLQTETLSLYLYMYLDFEFVLYTDIMSLHYRQRI